MALLDSCESKEKEISRQSNSIDNGHRQMLLKVMYVEYDQKLNATWAEGMMNS